MKNPVTLIFSGNERKNLTNAKRQLKKVTFVILQDDVILSKLFFCQEKEI